METREKPKRGRPAKYALIPCPHCWEGQTATHLRAHLQTCPVRLAEVREVEAALGPDTRMHFRCTGCSIKIISARDESGPHGCGGKIYIVEAER